MRESNSLRFSISPNQSVYIVGVNGRKLAPCSICNLRPSDDNTCINGRRFPLRSSSTGSNISRTLSNYQRPLTGLGVRLTACIVRYGCRPDLSPLAIQGMPCSGQPFLSHNTDSSLLILFSSHRMDTQQDEPRILCHSFYSKHFEHSNAVRRVRSPGDTDTTRRTAYRSP